LAPRRAVERAWLGVTEIEVMYDRHATRSSLPPTPLSGRARRHRGLLSERQADQCGADPEARCRTRLVDPARWPAQDLPVQPLIG
jgi:hypothetical protein